MTSTAAATTGPASGPRPVRTDETQLTLTRPGHYLAWLSARTPAAQEHPGGAQAECHEPGICVRDPQSAATNEPMPGGPTLAQAERLTGQREIEKEGRGRMNTGKREQAQVQEKVPDKGGGCYFLPFFIAWCRTGLSYGGAVSPRSRTERGP